MGNKTLIISISTLVIIILVIISLRGKSTQMSEQNVDVFNSTQAQYIANSGLQIALNKLRFNKNLRGTFNNNPLMGGSYDFLISGTDTVLIRVNSRYMNKTGRASVKTIWQNISLPTINAAVGVSSTNINVALHGNILISGIDRNPNGTPGTAPAVSGISVETIVDSIRIVNSLNKNDISNIIGKGPSPSISVNYNPPNYIGLINQYAQSADIILQSGTYTTGTILGTPENPKITYIAGDANFAGNAYGAGILIVYGDMSCAGNFIFQGLVIVYGNTQISASASGNSAIYGAMLVIGPRVEVSATGSAIINYSSSTLKNLQQKLKSSKFLVTDWVD